MMISTIPLKEKAAIPEVAWEGRWEPSLAGGDWHPAYYLALGTEALEHCSSDACLRCGRGKRV